MPLMIRKVSPTIFIEKTIENKKSKNKEIHKKLKKTIKYIGNRSRFQIFFHIYLLRILKRVFRQKICIFGALFSDLELNSVFMHKLAKFINVKSFSGN